jgi:hypothetical protein
MGTMQIVRKQLKDQIIDNSKVDDAAAIAESKLALAYATHSPANDPTTDQKAALAGEGTPSGTNKFTTKDYITGLGIGTAAEDETTAGARTTLMLSHTPLSATVLIVVYCGQVLRRVVAAPGQGEYTWATTTVTLGFTADDGDWLYANYVY